MNDPMRHAPTHKQDSPKWIGGNGLRAKLLRSHLAIALLGIGMLGVALVTVLSMRATGVHLADRDGPLVWHSMRAMTGLQRSLAGLRGWIALGDQSFIQERNKAWKNEIEPSIKTLEALCQAAGDSEQIQQIQRAKSLLQDLKEAQWWIEDIAQTPGNMPAQTIMIKNAEPIGRSLDSTITALLELEKEQEVGAQRKATLGRIADLRFSFASSQKTLRDLVSSGKSLSRKKLRHNLDIVSEHIESISAKAKLLTPRQRHLISLVSEEFQQYLVFCENIIAVPADQWYVARHLLATQTAPIATEVTLVLESIAALHQRAMGQANMELVTTSDIGVTMLVLMLMAMAGMATLLSVRGASRITQPIGVLVQATRDLAAGRLRENIPVFATDELGRLAIAFNTMRENLREKDEALHESEIRVRTIVTTAADGIITIDEKGILQSINTAAEKMFGYAESEMIGKNVNLLMPLPYRNEYDKNLQCYLETGVKTILGGHHEVTGRRKDGSSFPLDLTTSEARFGDCHIFTGIVRDITERKKVEAELKSFSCRQETVKKLGQLALASANLSTLMDEAVKLVAQTLDVEFCKILEFQPDKESLRLQAGVGWKEGLVGFATIGVGLDSQAGYTLLTKNSVIVQDLRVEERFSGMPLLHDHGVISGISVVIGQIEQPFGVFSVHTARQRTFTDKESHFLESVAFVIAQALTRKLINEELSRRVMEAEMLHRTASLASECMSQEDAMQRCLDIVCEMTEWPVGHVYLISDEGTEELVPSAIWHIEDETAFVSFREVTERTPFRIGVGLPGCILEAGEPTWIRNVQSAPNFPRAKACGDIGVKSAFGFPVKIDGKVVAVLEFFSRKKIDPDEHLLAVTQNIGAQLGRVFERQRDAHELALYANSVEVKNLELRAAKEEADESRQRAEKAKEQLTATQQRLMSASRQAGMAEIATGVLHNVGNVLNSVNVSATVVSDKLRKSKVSSLAKAVELMHEHAHDLGSFITIDEKGKKLPAYLDKLAGHLTAEHGSMMGELRVLAKNIDHIKKIVSTQQSHAGGYGVVETVSIAEIVDDAVDVNSTSSERYGIEITREYADLPLISVDKQKLMQILVNLIRNAKHAVLDGDCKDKRLTLKIDRNGETHVYIKVIDNGMGIAPEHLTKIFSHGFTTKDDGHGFGLHSAALAAKEMHGSLNVHSDGPGMGATFTLDLPIERTEATA